MGLALAVVMRSGRRHRRKVLNLRIKRDLQLRMLGRIFLLLLVGLVFCSAVFYVFADREVGNTYRLFHVRAKNFLDILLPVVIGAFCLGLFVSGLVSLFFPKRIAGPLYRIERELDRIGNGDLSVRLVLRRRDELKSLAEGINRMVGGLRERIEGVERTLEGARDLFPEDGEMGEQMTRLKGVHEALSREIGRFRLQRDPGSRVEPRNDGPGSG